MKIKDKIDEKTTFTPTLKQGEALKQSGYMEYKATATIKAPSKAKEKQFALDPDEPMILRSFMIPITLEPELATIAYKTKRSKSEVIRDLIIIGLNSEYAVVSPLNEPPPALMDGALVNRTANFPINLDRNLKERARTENVSKNVVIRRLLYRGLQYSQLGKQSKADE